MRVTRQQMRQQWLDKKAGKPQPDPVEETERKLTEAQAKLEALNEREKDRRQLATGSDYYLVVTFRSRDEKECFLALSGCIHLGPGPFIRGRDMAEALGVDLIVDEPELPDPSPPKRRLVDLT